MRPRVRLAARQSISRTPLPLCVPTGPTVTLTAVTKYELRSADSEGDMPELLGTVTAVYTRHFELGQTPDMGKVALFPSVCADEQEARGLDDAPATDEGPATGDAQGTGDGSSSSDAPAIGDDGPSSSGAPNASDGPPAGTPSGGTT